MDTTQVDTLSKYGTVFQLKVLANLLSSVDFLQQSLDVLNPLFFESNASQWIVEETVKYFSFYKTLPTLEVFRIEIDKIRDEVLKLGVKEQLRNIFQRKNDEDLQYVKDQFLDFAKNQAIKSAIIRSVDLLSGGRYGEIKDLVDTALKSGQPRNIGHNWKSDFEMRIAGQSRIVIPTGWDAIDSMIGGGLGAGELGVIAAPSGIGKSWCLGTIGANAARLGKRVVVYTLELNESYMGLRYDTIFTGIEPGSIPNNPDVVRQVVDDIEGDIIIKYYPARSVTVHTLAAHLEHLAMNKLSPDIILIDYADLMRATSKTEARYQELGLIYEEIRSFGGEYKIPVWTASQTQRCLTLDTIVETPAGNIEIGKIKEGDEVNTHLGFKKVTKVFPVERQAVYEITLKSGKKIKCSAKHEFPTADGKLLSIETGLRVGEQLLTKK
jgi:replicative DNA helicase